MAGNGVNMEAIDAVGDALREPLKTAIQAQHFGVAEAILSAEFALIKVKQKILETDGAGTVEKVPVVRAPRVARNGGDSTSIQTPE